jgi:hypothetical protein
LVEEVDRDAGADALGNDVSLKVRKREHEMD